MTKEKLLMRFKFYDKSNNFNLICQLKISQTLNIHEFLHLALEELARNYQNKKIFAKKACMLVV